MILITASLNTICNLYRLATSIFNYVYSKVNTSTVACSLGGGAATWRGGTTTGRGAVTRGGGTISRGRGITTGGGRTTIGSGAQSCSHEGLQTGGGAEEGLQGGGGNNRESLGQWTKQEAPTSCTNNELHIAKGVGKLFNHIQASRRMVLSSGIWKDHLQWSISDLSAITISNHLQWSISLQDFNSLVYWQPAFIQYSQVNFTCTFLLHLSLSQYHQYCYQR